MKFETVLTDVKDHIGTITFNRPEQLNTFSTTLAEELAEALLWMQEEKDVHVIVLKGNGRAFCAGIDISEFEGKNIVQYREWIERMERPIHLIPKISKPVIASAHGFAVANGIGLVAASDLAIVTEDIKMGATAINVGLFCMGPGVPLARSLGNKKALYLLFTGDMINGKEAEEIGLVNKAVASGALEEETLKLAQKLAAKSPIALQMGKRAFYEMQDMPYSIGLSHTNELFAQLCTTYDAKEGVNAFLEKRKPEYKGY